MIVDGPWHKLGGDVIIWTLKWYTGMSGWRSERSDPSPPPPRSFNLKQDLLLFVSLCCVNPSDKQSHLFWVSARVFRLLNSIIKSQNFCGRKKCISKWSEWVRLKSLLHVALSAKRVGGKSGLGRVPRGHVWFGSNKMWHMLIKLKSGTLLTRWGAVYFWFPAIFDQWRFNV